MPTYIVKQKGFFDGQLYRPGDDQFGHITTDKPLKPLPDWLELESADGPAKVSKKRDAKQAEQNRIEKDEANFIGDGGSSTTIVTL